MNPTQGTDFVIRSYGARTDARLVSLPHDVERELTGNAVDDGAYYHPGGPGSVTDELHATSNTAVLPPTQNHAFVLPFYDTNIGHWIKE